MSRAPVRLVTNSLLAVALVILSVCTAMFIQHATRTVGFAYQMDYGEGVEIAMVSRLLSHQPLYTDIQQPPYHVGVYPPLYTVTVAALTTVTGLGYGTGR